MVREATDICLRVLKESNKSMFDSYSVRNSVLIISHITFRDCRVHCDFPYPISDLIKSLIPYFRSEALEPGA